jgi:hypothetical protein
VFVVVALANTCFFFLSFLPPFFFYNVEHGKEENFYSKRAYSSLGPHTSKVILLKKEGTPKRKRKKKEEKIFCKV